jgi:EAL domain-containing protein (putative c-di-GMP-specific phosphodiesterase class I)
LRHSGGYNGGRVDDRLLEQMDQSLNGWDDSLARLRNALEKDELALYCQPIRAIGPAGAYPMAEVLVRLREEESALLPPGEFLPVFEHYKMMPQLDRWVVRKVIERLARGSKIPRFTVNLSGQTLEDAGFPKFVAGELMGAGVPPSSILFEIDEPDALGKPEAAARLAAAVTTIGVAVMIDGFGRRAASFSPLKALRTAFVKIDGSITRRVVSSEPACNKLKAILRVGHALGIGVIAECVEDQDVLTRLRALGVGYVQGFGIYRPHPIDAIAG